MISDSRISWIFPNGTRETYDFSQKIFQLQNSLDVLGYCGDSFFCLMNLSQIISYLNNSTVFTNSNSFLAKKNMIFKILEDSLNLYPSSVEQDFTIYWNSLIGNEFYSHGFRYLKKNGILKDKKIKFPTTMKWVFYDGSGGKYYFKALKNLNFEDYNFSRTYFKALVDIIESKIDWQTGGPPQMISIRKEFNDIQSTSVIYNGRFYLHGIEDQLISDPVKVEYRDLDFNFYTADYKKRNNYTKSFKRKMNLENWRNSITKTSS